MKSFVVAAVAAASFCGACIVAGPACAMPMDNLAAATNGDVSRVQAAGYDCGPFGCWPSSYYDTPAYLRPRAYYGMEPRRMGYDQWRWYGFGPDWPVDRKARRPR